MNTKPNAKQISYLPFGAGGVVRSLESKMLEFVSITDKGASPFATAAVNTAAIQAALNDAAGKARVYIPSGTYLVNNTIRIPSDSYLYGDGAGSVIKMAPTVGRNTTTVQTGTRNQKRENIVIEDVTIDANRDRWDVSGGVVEVVLGETLNTDGIALNICYSEYVVLRGVRCIDGYKHSLDIQAPRYVTGTNGATYDTQPSRFVWVENCYATGGGDDNITTHYSSDIWFYGCVSENPSGRRTPGNSNCFEIDDGTRNVFITDCLAIGGICGLQIKGHNYAPAPYNVVVDGMRCINNVIGVEVRHTGWYGSVSDDDGVSETLDENGNPILYTGASPTARHVTLSNVEVIAPRSVTNFGGTYPALYGIRIRSYENVSLSNVSISDGSLDLAGDYLPGTALTGYLGSQIRLYSGARRVNIQSLSLYGFSGSDAGLVVTGSYVGGLFVDGFVSVGGPPNPIRCSGGTATYTGVIENFAISGNQPNSTAVVVSAPLLRVGQGSVVGYQRSVSAVTSREIRRNAISSDNNAVDMQEVDSFVWHEGIQNLGEGEGIKQSWKVQLIDDVADFEVGYTGFRKTTSADDRASEFVVGVSSDGTAAPLRAFAVRPSGATWSRPLTVATLPAASIGAGSRAFVTNANSTDFASVVVGGGSNGVPVYSDGTHWRIG